MRKIYVQIPIGDKKNSIARKSGLLLLQKKKITKNLKKRKKIFLFLF